MGPPTPAALPGRHRCRARSGAGRQCRRGRPLHRPHRHRGHRRPHPSGRSRARPLRRLRHHARSRNPLGPQGDRGRAAAREGELDARPRTRRHGHRGRCPRSAPARHPRRLRAGRPVPHLAALHDGQRTPAQPADRLRDPRRRLPHVSARPRGDRRHRSGPAPTGGPPRAQRREHPLRGPHHDPRVGRGRAWSAAPCRSSRRPSSGGTRCPTTSPATTCSPSVTSSERDSGSQPSGIRNGPYAAGLGPRPRAAGAGLSQRASPAAARSRRRCPG